MERYEYKGRFFSIYLNRVGKHYNWEYMDDQMHRHKNNDELAPTQEVALSEAKDSIHSFVDKRK